MDASSEAEIRRALSHFPRGHYLLTARHELKRAGQFVEAVQPCAHAPLMVCVTARKGHPVEPLIRDAHCFAVCRVDAEDKLLSRKFTSLGDTVPSGDPFDALEVDRLQTGAPVPRRCVAALDCEVVRHLDVDADHELYIGLVVAGRSYAGLT